MGPMMASISSKRDLIMMGYGSHEGKSGNMVLNIAKYDFNMDK